MSNKPKRTVTGEFEGVYGPGGVLNIGKNKTTSELLDNIPESNLNSNEIIENNIERSRSRINSRSNSKINLKTYSDTNNKSKDIEVIPNKNLEMKETLKIPNSIQSIQTPSISSPFKIIYIVILLAILIIVILFFFYKDKIIQFFNSIFKSNKVDTPNEDISKSDNSNKPTVDENKPKVDDTEKEVKSTSNDPAVKTLNNKLNNISPYKEANVTSDGFCYIGYDDGQRECVDVYAGDVCMSGEIFPSLDICINPKLRP
jgi:hypothetical protein